MPTRKGRLTTLLELVRLPNVFTAPSDVAMGMAVSGVALTSSHAALLLASACAYAGGMALNDACDAPLDARERPERPIPSGRISRASAFGVAAVLLGLSVGLAATSGLRPFVASLLLVGAIVFYDAVAKGTAAGPPVMGEAVGVVPVAERAIHALAKRRPST